MLIIALALALSACSGAQHPVATSRHTMASSPAPPVTPASCLSAEPTLKPVSVGALDVQVIGTGSSAIVISNESGQELCGWKDVAHSFVVQGYTVALYDYVGAPDDNAVAVATWMRSHGSTRVALFGGSMGAMASVIAAARLKPAPDALVALSAEQYLQGQDVAKSAAKLGCPTLFVTADHDPYGSDSSDAEFQKVAPSGVSTLTVVPGSDHGIVLLSHPDVARQVATFLRTHLG
jgi:pimeloyl-ACP methyl ester carboxylesterase